MSNHDWGPSKLGHGETMCSRCFVTNREAAVLGMAECPSPPTPPTAKNDNEPAYYLHPEDDDGECPHCGGDGFTFDCFDGCCADSEIGCDDCTRPCSTCGIKTSAMPDGLAEILVSALKQNT